MTLLNTDMLRWMFFSRVESDQSVCLHLFLLLFFSLLPEPKINVASGCTFCFFPEKKKEPIPMLVFSGSSDTVFYFLVAALCKLFVGNSLLNLQLGLCA